MTEFQEPELRKRLAQARKFLVDKVLPELNKFQGIGYGVGDHDTESNDRPARAWLLWADVNIKIAVNVDFRDEPCSVTVEKTGGDEHESSKDVPLEDLSLRPWVLAQIDKYAEIAKFEVTPSTFESVILTSGSFMFVVLRRNVVC